MNKENSENKTDFGYPSRIDILQDPACGKDLEANIMPYSSLLNHIRMIVRVTNYILVSVKITFKKMEKAMSKNIFTVHIRPEVQHTSTDGSPHLRKQN